MDYFPNPESSHENSDKHTTRDPQYWLALLSSPLPQHPSIPARFSFLVSRFYLRALISHSPSTTRPEGICRRRLAMNELFAHEARRSRARLWFDVPRA